MLKNWKVEVDCSSRGITPSHTSGSYVPHRCRGAKGHSQQMGSHAHTHAHTDTYMHTCTHTHPGCHQLLTLVIVTLMNTCSFPHCEGIFPFNSLLLIWKPDLSSWGDDSEPVGKSHFPRTHIIPFAKWCIMACMHTHVYMHMHTNKLIFKTRLSTNRIKCFPCIPTFPWWLNMLNLEPGGFSPQPSHQRPLLQKQSQKFPWKQTKVLRGTLRQKHSLRENITGTWS